MATTGRGIVYPTTANAITPLATHFANLATSADTAIGNGITASLITGTTTARNTKYGTPANDAQRVALANQKVAWFNTDLGWWESYYATTGLAGLTVTGLMSGTASGWYPVGGGPLLYLVPGAPQTLVAGSTYTLWSAPGTNKSFRRGGTAWFTVAAGVVTLPAAGKYRSACTVSVQPGAGSGRMGITRNGATTDPNILNEVQVTLGGSFDTNWSMTNGLFTAAAGDNFRLYALSIGSAQFFPGTDGQRERLGQWAIEYVGPNLVSD